MSLEQVNKMAYTLSELRNCVDIYKGFFYEKNDSEVFRHQFKEIGISIQKSLITHLIVGCAAIFTDPKKQRENENLSFENLHEKYSATFSQGTQKLYDEIQEILKQMNLKEFRNKHVGHFDLDVKLNKRTVHSTITTDGLESLICKGERLINLIIRDAQLLPPNNSLAFYSPIPKQRSTEHFLNLLRLKKTEAK